MPSTLLRALRFSVAVDGGRGTYGSGGRAGLASQAVGCSPCAGPAGFLAAVDCFVAVAVHPWGASRLAFGLGRVCSGRVLAVCVGWLIPVCRGVGRASLGKPLGFPCTLPLFPRVTLGSVRTQICEHYFELHIV